MLQHFKQLRAWSQGQLTSQPECVTSPILQNSNFSRLRFLLPPNFSRLRFLLPPNSSRLRFLLHLADGSLLRMEFLATLKDGNIKHDGKPQRSTTRPYSAAIEHRSELAEEKVVVCCLNSQLCVMFLCI